MKANVTSNYINPRSVVGAGESIWLGEHTHRGREKGAERGCVMRGFWRGNLDISLEMYMGGAGEMDMGEVEVKKGKGK